MSTYRLSISSSSQGCFTAHETEGHCLRIEAALETWRAEFPHWLSQSLARRWSLSTSASLSSSPVWVVPSLPFCRMLSVFMGGGCWGWSHKHVIINLTAMQSILLIRNLDTVSFLLWCHKGRPPPWDKTICSSQNEKPLSLCFAKRCKSQMFEAS